MVLASSEESLFKSRWQPHRLKAYMPGAFRCLLLKGPVHLHHTRSSDTKVSTSPSHCKALCLLLKVPYSQAGANLSTTHAIELKLSFWISVSSELNTGGRKRSILLRKQDSVLVSSHPSFVPLNCDGTGCLRETFLFVVTYPCRRARLWTHIHTKRVHNARNGEGFFWTNTCIGAHGLLVFQKPRKPPCINHHLPSIRSTWHVTLQMGCKILSHLHTFVRSSRYSLILPKCSVIFSWKAL